MDNLKDWGYKLKRTELLDRQGDTMQIYFAEARAPFPYKNRYGIYLNTFHWDRDQKLLRIEIELLEDYPFDAEDLILMKGSGYWEARVLEDDHLEVVFEMHVDP